MRIKLFYNRKVRIIMTLGREMKKVEVNKREVEDLIGYQITDSQFEEALIYAKRKQEYIYKREQREVVMQHWYLVKLTEEYVRSLALSKFTMDLCSALRDMEKEHLVKNQSAPTDIYSVTA